MILSFHPCFEADIQLILGDQALGSDHIRLIERAAAILLPQACTQDLFRICAESKAFVFPDYAARIQYPGKIGQQRLFETWHLRCPKTFCWRSVRHFEEVQSRSSHMPHAYPFLFKEDKSHEGNGVFFLENEGGLEAALAQLEVRERSGSRGFVSQDYIPCGGNVLRAVIMGERMVTYWKRPGNPKAVITTLSRGAGLDYDWRPALQRKGEVQARLLSAKTGINLAAVDFVFPHASQDPEPHFLEINYYFGRRGLGGSETYYGLLYAVIRDWLKGRGLDPDAVRLI